MLCAGRLQDQISNEHTNKYITFLFKSKIKMAYAFFPAVMTSYCITQNDAQHGFKFEYMTIRLLVFLHFLLCQCYKFDLICFLLKFTVQLMFKYVCIIEKQKFLLFFKRQIFDLLQMQIKSQLFSPLAAQLSPSYHHSVFTDTSVEVID